MKTNHIYIHHTLPGKRHRCKKHNTTLGASSTHVHPHKRCLHEQQTSSIHLKIPCYRKRPSPTNKQYVHKQNTTNRHHLMRTTKLFLINEGPNFLYTNWRRQLFERTKRNHRIFFWYNLKAVRLHTLYIV